MNEQLLNACATGDLVSVKDALENGGADIETRDNEIGRTPLMIAVVSNHLPIVKYLVSRGANVNARETTRYNRSILHVACEVSSLKVIRCLLLHGADVEARDSLLGFTPLFDAAMQNRHDVVQCSIEHYDADALATNNNGQNCMHIASGHKSFGVSEYYLSTVVEGGSLLVNAQDESGATPIFYSCGKEIEDPDSAEPDISLPMVRLLVAAGADISIADNDGKTALDYASEQHSSIEEDNDEANDIIECLLKAYAEHIARTNALLSIHALLAQVTYLYSYTGTFHSPLAPLRMQLPVGKITVQHMQTLLALLYSHHPTVLETPDENGDLPLHLACRSSATPIEVIHYLLAQYNAAAFVRNKNGALPFHLLCATVGPALDTVKCLMLANPSAVDTQTIQGEMPFLLACKASAASAADQDNDGGDTTNDTSVLMKLLTEKPHETLQCIQRVVARDDTTFDS